MATIQDNVNLDNPGNSRRDAEDRNDPKVTNADHPMRRGDDRPADGATSERPSESESSMASTAMPPMILEVAAILQPGSAMMPPVIAEPPVFDTHAPTIRDPKVTMVGESTSHRDPLSGESGTHPVGVGIGAAAGGAAAGAAGGLMAGMVAGPLGMAIGAAAGTLVGAIAGGYAGKEIAERVHPTTEDHYWRSAYVSRPYVTEGSRYEEYEPAYLHGIQMRDRLIEKTWEEAEPEIRIAWENSSHAVIMNWPRARPMIQDAWDRLTPEPGEPEATEEERRAE